MKKTVFNQQIKSKLILGICTSILATTIFISCGGGEKAEDGTATETATINETALTETHFTMTDLVDFDMSSTGINVITKAPKNAKTFKYDANGNISVYGGKFFKISFSYLDGSVADVISSIKGSLTDKEMNPSFDKVEMEDETGFLIKSTDGKLSFNHGIQVGDKTLIISEGMPYDISPDQFTDYTAEDVKLMYEAAKATKIK
jgi:hypothetical protein